MKDMAAQGRTVFVSSHLMGEMQQSTDRVIVINRGRLVADVEVDELIYWSSTGESPVAAHG